MIFGKDARASADEMARRNETINYEITCDVGKRVPRAFLDGERLLGWQDHLISDREEPLL
jgi:alanine racemase